MKKIVFVLVLLLAFSLSGCTAGMMAAGMLLAKPKHDNKVTIEATTAHTEIAQTETVEETDSVSIEATETADVTETTEATEAFTLPLPEESMMMYFSSGAGGWGTEITLYRDGTFYGSFHDSEMGSTGKGYPNGTVYICNFSGKFVDIEQIDENSYRMHLVSLATEHEEGFEWIENEILYIASYPYGLDGGDEFVFYLPDTPTGQLSEDFLSWWPGRYESFENPKATLSYYGILNVANDQGFFSYG